MMDKSVKKAFGSHYFTSGTPIAVSEVNPSASAQHPHDLTEIEHFHDFCELVLITAGSTIHRIDGEEFPVSAGDLFLIQGHVRHHFAERGRIGMLNVQFDPDRLPLPFHSLRQIPGYNVIFHLEPTLRDKSGANRLRLNGEKRTHAEELVRRLQRELRIATPGFEAAALALLLELIVFVARSYAEVPQTDHAALLRMGEVIGRIEREFSSRISLAELARSAHMSSNHLLRLFKTATGSTPGEYLLQVRLTRAARLLHRKELTIGEVAEASGFADSNYFSRQFRTRYGKSPRAYRSSAVAGNESRSITPTQEQKPENTPISGGN